jgi:formylglycine-generating enzyme required for sulfatase activity
MLRESENSELRLDELQTEDMVWIPGGTFQMGSDHHYGEEAPAHRVTVDGFWIDRTPVTNVQFRDFVRATGHITLAEIPPDPTLLRDALPQMGHAGSQVFMPPQRVRSLRDESQWWAFISGANWRHPQGPRTNINVLGSHPVVHIAYSDAQAYARWAGKELPTEAEWEFAARGGLDDEEYAWGNALAPGGVHLANTWQGNFPVQNLCEDGYDRTSPVRAYPPNGFGVHDMIGNAWEWTADWWSAYPAADASKPLRILRNPRGGREQESFDPAKPEFGMPRKVIKGGSHLSAPNYCRRYRPAARQAATIDRSASDLGFRCVIRPANATLQPRL